MKLSTRCRYGIHAMADLAQHYGQGPQSLREIAERQEVSEMFLEQIFGALRREGFVESVRGAQGGYLLAKPPEEITIGALMTLVPGVAITNAMREIMGGDMVAGISRVAEGVLIATAIALGTGVAMSLSRLFWGA